VSDASACGLTPPSGRQHESLAHPVSCVGGRRPNQNVRLVEPDFPSGSGSLSFVVIAAVITRSSRHAGFVADWLTEFRDCLSRGVRLCTSDFDPSAGRPIITEWT
jgi:hypothetical protein